MSHVPCQMSPVTCHQRQQPQPQTLPLVTPPLCIVTQETFQNPKNVKTLKRGSKFSDTVFDQKYPAFLVPAANRGDTRPTDIATYRLNQPWSIQ